jgi:FtsP/CotA-like multicopper oxidase with cupredoxin domain
VPRTTFHHVVCSCSALVVLVATHTQLLAPSPPGVGPAIQANSNRVLAGKLESGILTLHLELRQGDWYPEADSGPSMRAYAFGEEGEALQVPGPLIRVPEGTEIHVTLHNLLEATAVVHGLHQHPGDAKATVEVPPQETRELRFTAGAAGTYQYYASARVEPWATPVARFERTVSLRGRSWSTRRGKQSQIGFLCWEYGGADPTLRHSQGRPNSRT